jgi:hypothetical protein
LRGSAVPARLDIEVADIEPTDIEVAAFADTDPARRRPDGAPEVRYIPSSLQQQGPRERSFEKSFGRSAYEYTP